MRCLLPARPSPSEPPVSVGPMVEQNFPDNIIYELDNLDVLRGMDSETVDLIATDPPFNTKRNRAGMAGSYVDNWKWGDTGVLPDQWAWNEVHPVWLEQIKDDNPALHAVIEASRVCHGDDIAAFLCFLSVRLLEMHRILKSTGSIYLHCDHTANGYIRMAMDAIFGRRNFKNEVIWCYAGGGVPADPFARKHDTLFYYAKSKHGVFNRQYVPYSPASRKLVGSKGGVSIDGKPRDIVRGAAMPDWWADINSLQTWSPERTGSPDQKPLALYERVILASSNKGDLVLDPFAGCATTIMAAQKHGRRWVGIDRRKDARYHVVCRMAGIKPKDADAIRKRPDLAEWLDAQLARYDAHYSTNAPIRTDTGEHAAPLLQPVFPKVLQPWQRLRHADMQRILNRIQQTQHDHAIATCAGCGRDVESAFMHLDHINPKSGGGENYIVNRIMLCPECNRKKSNNLTLPGLWRENKKDGWAKDEPKARATLLAVQ